MTAPAPKVLLCWRFERTSAKGRRYFTGRLGSAKVIAFEERDVAEDQRYGAEAVWRVYLQAPEDDREQRPRQQVLPPPTRGQSTWDRSRDLPVVGETRAIRNQRSDPRQQHIYDLAARFKPDEEVPF
jgi:hypothetical protein